MIYRGLCFYNPKYFYLTADDADFADLTLIFICSTLNQRELTKISVIGG
jgi:hypothetical protein